MKKIAKILKFPGKMGKKSKISNFFKFFVDTIISFCYNQIVAETSNFGGIPKSG